MPERLKLRVLAWTLPTALLVAAPLAPAPAQSRPSATLLLPSGASPRADVDDSQVYLERATAAGPKFAETDPRVDALLARMTLEEKVGQMTQLAIDMVSTGQGPELKIDPAKLEKAVVTYGVGSILNVNGSAFSVDQWHGAIGQIQEAAGRTRLKIPVLYGIDTIHGVNYVRTGTLFPQSTGMAATWNPELAERCAHVAAMETRALGIPWNFSPVLDIGRQPLWPRFYETYGEDPYLAKVMGVAYVRGYEGTDVSAPDRVASCLKHYMGYSLPLSGRDRTPAWIPEIHMREYVLPSFAAAVAAGARTVMVNSGEVNGVPVHASHYILTDVLRGELGFKGLVVSDWEDIKKLVTVHAVAADETAATRMAVMAGVDMSMVPLDYSFADNLVALVKEGAVPESRIDEAVRRVLKLKVDLGLFERPGPDPAAKAKVGTADSRRVALEAARESITLLKNTGGVLPLAKGRKVLVTGPAADSLVALNNGWSFTWQGADASVYPTDRVTVLGAVRALAGEGNVVYVPGAGFDKTIDVAAAADAARAADVAVVCVGESAYAETPGNIEDLTLSEPQLALVEAVAAAGKPVVLVLVEGRPRVITRVEDRAAAVVMAYNPGLEGGQAIAEVLYGEVNPSGRLPFTYPRYANATLTYDHKAWETEETSFGNTRYTPLFEFGSGLSYTTFAYSDLAGGRPERAGGGALSV
jgi:beta-glucosidase